MNRLHPNWQTAAAIAALLGCFFLGQFLDSPSDWEAEKASAASLRDALAQAQKDRPELWTAEHKKRADVAVGIVAKGVQP